MCLDMVYDVFVVYNVFVVYDVLVVYGVYEVYEVKGYLNNFGFCIEKKKFIFKSNFFS